MVSGAFAAGARAGLLRAPPLLSRDRWAALEEHLSEDESLVSLSLSREQNAHIKTAAGLDRYPKAEFSLAFALELLAMAAAGFLPPHAVLDEIDALEGLRSSTHTRPAKRLRRDLRMFWHKHFFSPRLLVPNLVAEFHQSPQGMARIERAFTKASDQGDDAMSVLAHELTVGAYQNRSAARRVTGEWIVFRPYQGKNYYLAIASHRESKALHERLQRSCKAEFPFLF